MIATGKRIEVQRLAVVQAVGGPTPLLVKVKRRWREHKAARELGGCGLGRGERGAVTVRAGLMGDRGWIVRHVEESSCVLKP